MANKTIILQFIRFGIVGCLATGIHYGIYYLLQQYMAVNVAYTIGYLIGFIANFYLTAYFTFKSSPSWRNLIGMGGAHAVNYGLHIVLLNLFLWMGLSNELKKGYE